MLSTIRRPAALASLCFVAALTAVGSAVAGPQDRGSIGPAAPEGAAQAHQSAGEFPDSYYFRGQNRPAELRALEGEPAPEWHIDDWIGDSLSPAETEGKVLVIDFWATWCRPCMQAIPHNVELVEEHGDRGLVFLGIHDANRGYERAANVVEQHQINYYIGRDDGGRSTRAFNLRFWPTYIVIDRQGTVRAAGLTPNAVDRVVEKLLDEDADGQPSAGAEVPSDWLEGSSRSRQRFNELAEKEQPPALDASTWLNTEDNQPLKLEDLRGQVVMLDFWATWCGPCRRSMPKTNDLYEKHKEDGLVVIGICHPRRASRMAAAAEQWPIRFPICADAEGEIGDAYRVNGYPDYYFIDRAGTLRIIDCKNHRIEDAIALLLAEDPPADLADDDDQEETEAQAQR